MLGNGLRVVMAWAGEAFVISRGVAQRLEINPATGLTVVTYRTGVPMGPELGVSSSSRPAAWCLWVPRTLGLREGRLSRSWECVPGFT